jgi:hypothetical protein
MADPAGMVTATSVDALITALDGDAATPAKATASSGPSAELPFKLDDPDLLRFESYANGEFVSASTGARFDIIDPGTGKVWATCPDCTRGDVDPAVRSSYEAFQLV